MEVGNLGKTYSLLNLAYVGDAASVASGIYSAPTQKSPVFRLGLSLNLMPGSSLLSHGETPHYHRRYGVSLLSSAWGQVGPPR